MTAAWLTRMLNDERFRRRGPLALVVGIALWVVHPLWRETPLSYDHSAHLFKAWHFWTEMLPRGRLRGWSHFWAFGFPSDELVPFGEELWVCLFRALSLGQLSWTRTYALAFAAFIVLKAVTAYIFTRRYFGATAAVAGALFALFDPGAMLKGGWRWHTHWGVWPVELAMCFLLLAFVSIDRALERGTARRVAFAGLWTAAALLSHQLAPLVLLLTAPLLFLDRVYRKRAEGSAHPPEGAGGAERAHFGAGLGAVAFGSGLAAFAIVPFVARSPHAQDLGWLGDSLSVVSHNLLTLRTFENETPAVHALGLIGAWFAFRERRPGALFFTWSAALFVFLSSDTLVSDLHLERALSTVLKIETDRMLVAAKLFWFPLAGHGFAEVLRRPASALRGAARWPRALAAFFALAVAALLVAPGAKQFYESQIRKEFEGESTRKYWDDFKAFAEWSSTLERKPGEFYRIAYHFPLNEHLPTLAPVFNGIPMYKVGSTPTQIFDKFPTSDEPELFEALGVKYVLSAYPLKRPDLELERRFGALHWYRFSRFQSLPFTLLGEGQAELLELEPERIRIRLSGTSPGARIKVHVSTYDRWRATLDGETVPIASVPVFGVEYPMLMELPARDGELVIQYVYRTAEWLGLAITLASIGVFAGFAWFGAPVVPAPVLALSRRWLPAAVPGALALVLVLVVIIALRTRDRSRLLPPNSIFHRLAGPELELDGQRCTKRAPLVFRCGQASLRADIVPGFWGIHACMTAPDAQRLRVRAALPLESFVFGRYDPHPKSGAGKIQAGVNGTPLGSVDTRPPNQRLQFIQFDTRSFSGQRAELELYLDGAALHCFDFRLLP